MRVTAKMINVMWTKASLFQGSIYSTTTRDQTVITGSLSAEFFGCGQQNKKNRINSQAEEQKDITGWSKWGSRCWAGLTTSGMQLQEGSGHHSHFISSMLALGWWAESGAFAFWFSLCVSWRRDRFVRGGGGATTNIYGSQETTHESCRVLKVVEDLVTIKHLTLRMGMGVLAPK